MSASFLLYCIVNKTQKDMPKNPMIEIATDIGKLIYKIEKILPHAVRQKRALGVIQNQLYRASKEDPRIPEGHGQPVIKVKGKVKAITPKLEKVQLQGDPLLRLDIEAASEMMIKNAARDINERNNDMTIDLTKSLRSIKMAVKKYVNLEKSKQIDSTNT